MLTPLILAMLSHALPASQRPPTDAAVERRVEEILGKMTVEEKIDYIGGYRGFYTQPIARLGLDPYKMSDGPAGVRNYGPDTAYTSPVTMAASWDPELARRVGRSFGLDARQRGVHIVLAPGVNINRVPMNGRNFEYLGEDPYLASQLVAPWIQGIQGEGVIATVKHYAANSQEHGRWNYSMDVDERTLREIYFPAFEAAVKKGKVWSVMCAYNLLNGVYCSENKWLLDDVLKKDWGFQGFVMSDWGAVHSSIPVANGGLDLEMPGPQFLNRRTLTPALQDGTVSQATIDDKVRRMLRAFVSMGFLDRKQERPELPAESPEGAETTYQEAKEGMVLLKNDHNILPFDARKVKKIAVIGPNGHPAVWGGGGSAFTTPFRAISVRDAIAAAVPGATVTFAPGMVASSSESFGTARFQTESGANGLTAEYFNNKNLEGTPQVTRIDRRVNAHYENAPAPGIERTNFSVRWTGTFTVPETGDYEIVARGDDGFRVWIDGKKVIDEWRDQAAFDAMATLHFAADSTHSVKMEYYQGEGDAEIHLGWRKVSGRSIDEAVNAAKDADAVVVSVGFNPRLEGEGDDRTFRLPKGQDDLIKRVAAVNRNVVVVLNAGASVDTTRWLDKVPGFVQAWYPGQDGNRALAAILFGKENPSGKLPISFDRRWEYSAAYGNYPGDPEKRVKYAEGIFVGYRHYDASKYKPLYPFGFGLSYTTYGYSNLTVTPMRSHEPQVRVEFDVRNTGKRTGDEIAQVYVRAPKGSVPRPVKELKGFSRVRAIRPGASKHVVVTLDSRAFAYWDVAKKDWVVPHGEYRILVGGSSQNLPLSGSVRL
ncbi:glycoside hydrolase family 3 C-terminal domain-containing protein [Fimbriimonas ginsengisoli]|uniref:Glycoside hydrolase family protein n=1 Tax=Fimbriimonas ginsengisoli Gsoil 348 TaxID=661478 RepID=A0A068NNV2_FIMGI|nr:glycoside hydrolase family 3 C-terminal domain-containing protein [Fimbriimonas ginsengisoli]AIE85047.1 glycoside hydrolase family protein [Fimbriimonas ginsengisoli Gsoil 348]